MAGSPNKSIEIGDDAGYVQVRFIDYDRHGAPRYQWFVRKPDATVLDGGLELRLEPRAKPDATRAVAALMADLVKAGQSYDYELVSGERQPFRDDFTEPAAEWASANSEALGLAIEGLSASVSREL